ncbi:MAG TPA: PIN domain-containing protein [Candidatus Limnocylindria bacterium]|jgi:ribonuclease VapC|nr:PIN domain-containing protein [Candidatus Limnocylindria bacterium]
MPATLVLDSHALLAYFREEPGGEHVKELFHSAASTDRPLHMTEVNYAEVSYIVRRKDGEAAWAEAARILETLPIEFHPATRVLADLAAGFKARHRLSLADAFAAALAKEKKAELVTGDPEFKALEKEIKVNWLRR